MNVSGSKEWRLKGPFVPSFTGVSFWLNQQGAAIHLQQQELLTVRDGKGWKVQSLAGAVWITQEGELDDVILEAGESFTVERDGLTVIQAVGEATVVVSRQTHRVTGTSVTREQPVAADGNCFD